MSDTESNNIKNIDPENWTLLLNIFDELSGRTAAEQSQMMNARLESPDYCSFNELSEPAKCMLQKMLATENEPNILDQTIDPFVAGLLGHDAVIKQVNPGDIIGRSFGPWQVTQELAAGGMGQVFVANRADGQFEKTVALKIIKSGHFSTLSQQRFLEEMQTLAQFEHPNIARLIDGGTSDDGIAFFVMELVDGLPICEYAQRHNLALVARIELVLQAIKAVEYAHQNLIIHGDIKPANLLVNESGQIKLVDFGISRPLQATPAVTYLPQFTPCYTSPEQANGNPLTTASDVFGLCAVLYELCSGSPPRAKESVTTHFEYKQQLNTPIENVYQRYQMNLSNVADSGAVSNNDVKQFSDALSHELGTIIDMGLQIEISDRYKSTSELSNDLKLYLIGAAVPNHANNLWYRWRKTWQSYKTPIAASLVAVISVVVFAMIAFNQAQIARQEAEKANWSNQFLLSIFTEADPVKNKQNPITVNELTAAAAAKILADDSDLELKVDSLGLLSQIQYRLGEINSAEKLNLEQITLLNELPIDKQLLANAHVNAGATMEAQDKLAESVYHFRQAMKFMPVDQVVNEQSVRAVISFINSLIRINEVDEARSNLDTLIARESQIAELPEANSLLAALNALQASLALAELDFQNTLRFIMKAKNYAAQVDDEPMLYPHILGIESDAYFDSGDGEKAAEIDRELVDYFSINFGENHPETIDNLGRLAVSFATLGQLEAGIEINQRIITNVQGTQIKGHQLPAAYLNMGTAYQALGNHNKALESYGKARKLWPELEPRIPFYEASTDVKTAISWLALEQYVEAQKYFDGALKIISEEMGQEHPMYARFQIMYAPLLIAEGRLKEAESIIPSAYQTIIDAYGSDSRNAAVANLRLAQLNAALGDDVTAVIQAKSVIRVLDVSALRKRYQWAIDLAQELIQ